MKLKITIHRIFEKMITTLVKKKNWQVIEFLQKKLYDAFEFQKILSSEESYTQLLVAQGVIILDPE